MCYIYFGVLSYELVAEFKTHSQTQILNNLPLNFQNQINYNPLSKIVQSSFNAGFGWYGTWAPCLRFLVMWSFIDIGHLNHHKWKKFELNNYRYLKMQQIWFKAGLRPKLFEKKIKILNIIIRYLKWASKWYQKKYIFLTTKLYIALRSVIILV